MKNADKALTDITKQVYLKYGNRKAAAEAIGLHPEYFRQVLRGVHPLTNSVLNPFGWEVVTREEARKCKK
jgi:hypothetical protein